MAKKTSSSIRRSVVRGRPTIFDGPRRKVSLKLTELACDLIKAARETLAVEYGHAATDSAAVDYLVRRGARAPRAGRLPSATKLVEPLTTSEARDLIREMSLSR